MKNKDIERIERRRRNKVKDVNKNISSTRLAFTILFIGLFIFTVLMSFIYPPKGPLNSDLPKETIADILRKKPINELSEREKKFIDVDIAIRAASLNYNTFDNFSAQYKNTVLGWFGKSRTLKEFYMNLSYFKDTAPLKYSFINLGKNLPYIIMTSLILLFLISIQEPPKP